MLVIRYQSPTDFLSATEDLRSTEIVRTNLISSIANSVANGSRVYEAYYWWAVKEGDKTLRVAIRTAPYGYVFSPMPEAAIKMLMKEIQLADPEVKEYSGPKLVINEIERILEIMPAESEGAIPTLYTQADNPTSNKIYQNLGYELVDEIRRIKF